MNAYWQNRLFRAGILSPGLFDSGAQNGANPSNARRENGKATKIDEQPADESTPSETDTIEPVWIN